MVRISNGIITLLNILTLIVSFGIIGFSLLFYVKVETPCERFLRMPLLAMGGGLMLVSMVGLMGSCCRLSFFMWIYLITLFLLILGLIAFTIFTIVVTNKGVGNAISKGTGLIGYQNKVTDYSTWMQDYVINEQNWDKIRSCLVHARLCSWFEGGKDEEFYKQKMSTIQVSYLF